MGLGGPETLRSFPAERVATGRPPERLTIGPGKEKKIRYRSCKAYRVSDIRSCSASLHAEPTTTSSLRLQSTTDHKIPQRPLSPEFTRETRLRVEIHETTMKRRSQACIVIVIVTLEAETRGHHC
ncbi:hypothetical protein GN956_G17735 [Arapaima gigas]